MKFYNENIEKLRKERNLTQSGLAKELRRRFKVSVSPRTIDNYEKRKSVADAEFLVLLCKFFKKQINIFFAPIAYQSSMGKKIAESA